MKVYNLGHIFAQPVITSVQISDEFSVDHRVVVDRIGDMTEDQAFLYRNLTMVTTPSNDHIAVVLTRQAFDVLMSCGYPEFQQPEVVERLLELFRKAMHHHHPLDIYPPEHETPTPPEKIAEVWAQVAIHNAKEGGAS